MTTDFSKLKAKLDLPVWEPLDLIYTAANAAVTGVAGSCIASDLRASQYNNPNLWFLQASTILMQYNSVFNEWLQLASPALTGTFGAGAAIVFAPSHGPRGTIAAGATTNKITLTTALPATVSANQLVGQRIRIIDNAAGASGKIAERTIISNTAGTTPTITVDSAFGFTPLAGSAYEFLTGRVYLLSAGVLAAGVWKAFDLCTTSYLASLATTNLPATIATDSSILSMDELHTPLIGAGGANVAGEVGGYFGTLIATASSATSLTGQATGGDASVLANEYRNFQIRVVEDTANPTAVGQRRRISSHTAGVSPVYTVPAWTITPSATAKFTIENNNDIILWSSAGTATYRYDWLANSWDTTTYAARPAAIGAGCVSFHPFSGKQDADKNFRYSNIYSFRGGSVNTLDMLDIAGGATGLWAGAVAYDNAGLATFGASAGIEYDPVSNRAIIAGTQLLNFQCSMYMFDVASHSLKPFKRIPQIASTVTAGNRVGLNVYADGTDKKSFAYMIPSSIGQAYRSLLFV